MGHRQLTGVEQTARVSFVVDSYPVSIALPQDLPSGEYATLIDVANRQTTEVVSSAEVESAAAKIKA